MDDDRTDRVSISYMPQLDGLRAIAIVFVLVSHWAPQPIARAAPWGVVGVRLFFVLSGFLITSILIGCRQQAQNQRVGRLTVAGRFYARRFLRIFPIYYVTLGVAVLLAIPPVRETLGWHAGYLTNVYMTVKDKWPGPATPFWSLADEEQFYLIWPWVLLFVPRRALAGTMALIVFFGVASMGVAYGWHWNWSRINAQPLAGFPSLGLGALLAFWTNPRWGSDSARVVFCRVCLLAGIVLFFTGGALRFFFKEQELKLIGFVLGSSGISVWLIDRAARGFGGITGRLLKLPPLLYLGRISYGVYVIHLFVPPVLAMLLGAKWGTAARNPAARVLWVATTLALASFSWHLMEKPINSLRRFVPYIPTRAPSQLENMAV